MVEIKVENNELFVGDYSLKNYEIRREIGRGANGIVFLAKNLILERDEALKIWVKREEADNRDKLEQGLCEVQKLARVNGNNAIQIYSAQEINKHVVATMEYFNGQTMKDFIIGKHPSQICNVLRHYLDAIEKTSCFDTFHGDAHEKNVLIRQVVGDYENKIELKLCDFGTSVFSGKEKSFERHWRIVRETILKCTKNMKSVDYAKQLLLDWDNMLDKCKKGKLKFYDARIYTAPLKDYLEYIEAENSD